MAHPLRQLTRKDAEWVWSETHGVTSRLPSQEPLYCAFAACKMRLHSNATLLTQGGAALLQLQHPVSFASRALTQTETRYAQSHCVCQWKVWPVHLWAWCCERGDRSCASGRNLYGGSLKYQQYVHLKKDEELKWSICFSFGFKLPASTVKISHTPGISFSFIWVYRRLLPWQQTIVKNHFFAVFHLFASFSAYLETRQFCENDLGQYFHLKKTKNLSIGFLKI